MLTASSLSLAAISSAEEATRAPHSFAMARAAPGVMSQTETTCTPVQPRYPRRWLLATMPHPTMPTRKGLLMQ
jgi:hypothetical protein